ncbi:molybdopterin-dependent oxidoreductase [Microbacterium sp. No. 7]|uniref:molybdopterin-dependent oxidoreductase n=1 Tax=Microbacterium sp. No. 7 TaxID=1714373 RepID=UPI000A89FFA2|nr:molybdopterin-dependent oxidoreductase [Microbacterium sp. No. 7]
MNDAPERTVIRTCPICESTCGLEITLRGDRVLRTRGDGLDVLSKGFMCPKGASLGELYDDPDWLRGPLIRDGGRLREADWEEAFARTAELFRPILEQDGSTTTAVYMGNPIAHSMAGLLSARAIITTLRTPNLYSASTLDQRSKDLTNGLMFGDRFTLPVPDLDHTEFLVVIGANPLESNGSLATAPDWPRRLRDLRRRGGTLVVIDPVRTRTAEIADEHLRPRVGSDAALLLSMASVLFEEDMVRIGAAEPFARNLPRLREVVRPFTPERLEGFTGIPATDVRALTRAFARAASAVVYGRMGTSTTRFGTVASWMIDILNILTGNLDRRGGAMFPKPASGMLNTRGAPRFGPGIPMGRYHTRVRKAPELFGELPMSCLAEEIDTPGEGRYRGLVLISGNPVVSAPNSRRMANALQQLDAFVAIDPYVTDSTRFAHVIFPALSPLQRSHYDVHFTMWSVRNVANYSPPSIQKRHDQLDEWEIMCRLGGIFDGSMRSTGEIDEAMITSMIRSESRDEHSLIHGRKADEILSLLVPRVGPDRVLDFLLRVGPYGDGFGRVEGGLSLSLLEANPHGIDLGPLRPRLPEVLRTPDGMIDLAPDPILQDLGPLERAIDAGPQPGLVLIGRRQLRSNNSWLHNTPSLMTGRTRSTLRMSPEDAVERGLETGDTAKVESAAGELIALVEVSDRVPPGVVSLPHGWLHEPEEIGMTTARLRPGVNANILADETVVDAPSWNAVFNGIPVVVHGPQRLERTDRLLGESPTTGADESVPR